MPMTEEDFVCKARTLYRQASEHGICGVQPDPIAERHPIRVGGFVVLDHWGRVCVSEAHSVTPSMFRCGLNASVTIERPLPSPRRTTTQRGSGLPHPSCIRTGDS